MLWGIVVLVQLCNLITSIQSEIPDTVSQLRTPGAQLRTVI
jgi:hypothetical protein